MLVIFVFSCLLLLLTSVMRDISVGADYSRYLYHFYQGHFYSKYEPFFYFLASVVRWIFPEFNQFSDVVLGVSLGVVFYMIYKSRGYLWINLLLFQTSFIYVLMFSAMRQAVAIAFVAVALGFLNKGNNGKNKQVDYAIGSGLMLLAALTHYSAVFCLLILFAYWIRDHFKVYLFITAFSFIAMLFGSRILVTVLSLSQRQSHYTDYQMQWGISTILYLLLMFLLIMLPRLHRSQWNQIKLSTLKKDTLHLFNVMAIALYFNVFYVFIPAHFRITLYFYLTMGFLYSRVFDPKRKSDWVAIAVSFLYYIYSLYLDPISVIPYKIGVGLF